MDSKIDLQKNWTDHTVVTDEMVMNLKEELKVKPYEGLMIVSKDDHFKAFKQSIPDGYVAWLVVDKRLPKMTGYYLNDFNVVYTTPQGENGKRRKK